MPQSVMLPVAEYAPDQPAANGSANIINVYPRTPLSYGPIGQPMTQYDALPARCQGGAAYRDNDGNVFIFAGTSTDLYLLKAGLSGWQRVSKSPAAYSTGSEMWRFTYFGGRVLATNLTDPIQSFTLDGGAAFEDLDADAPRARYIAVVKNAFVVLGNTWDSTNGYLRQRVRWSPAGNATSWPALGTDAATQVQAGAVDLLGTGGDVIALAPDLNNADCVVFQQHAVRRMTWAGPPIVFSMQPVENAVGVLCPDSVVVHGGICYYWAHNGIRAFDGAESRPIGANKVDRTVYAELNNAFVNRVVGANDPINQLIWWAYPTANSLTGNPDRLLIYNWHLDRFSRAEISCETVLRLLSIGYTLDELYTVLGYTLDEVPAPLDSEIWTGGRLTLGIFDTTHTIGFLTGTPLAATVETEELQPPPGRRFLVTNSRPQVDGTGSAPSVAIGRRERLQDAVSYTGAVALNAMGQCPVRTSGRLIRARTTIAAGDDNWGHISGVELDLTPQGRR